MFTKVYFSLYAQVTQAKMLTLKLVPFFLIVNSVNCLKVLWIGKLSPCI